MIFMIGIYLNYLKYKKKKEIEIKFVLNMLITYNIELILYNYGLHEKLISIIIKLRKGYFPKFGRRPPENNPFSI